MNFIYALGFVVLRGVVKVFPVSSSSFARKMTRRNRARSHSGGGGGMTRPKDEMGFQIVSSESGISHPETNLQVGLLPLFFMQLLLSHMFLSFMV